MPAKTKAEIMAAKRSERAARGLERVEVYIPPSCRDRLTRYVQSHLSGEVQPRRKRKTAD